MTDCENPFRQIFEGSRDAIFLADEYARFIEVNRAACELTGFSRDELLHLSIPDLHEAQDPGPFHEQFASILSGREVSSEAFLLRKDGTKIPAEFSSRRMCFQGRPVVHTSARDASERMRAQEALEHSNRRIKDILESITECFFCVDHAWRILKINQKAAEFFGKLQEEMLGQVVWELFPQVDGSEFYLQFHAAVETASPVQFETPSAFAPGKWIECHAHPDEDGLSIYFRDITSRKAAEEAVRASEDKYRDLVDHSQDLICIHDLNGKILTLNKGTLRALGYEESEIIGWNIADFLISEHRQELQAYLDEIRLKGAGSGLMFVKTKQGDTRIWDYRNTLRTEGVSEPVVRGMAHDVTEQKSAERALRKAMVRLKELEAIVRRSPAVAYRCRAAAGWPFDYISENAEQFGYLVDDFTSGQVIYHVFAHPQDCPRVEEEVARYLEQGKNQFTVQYRARTKSGEFRWVEDCKWVQRDEAGNVTHFEGIILDCTERRRAEEELRKLSHAIEQSPVSVIITDLNGNIEYVNPKFSKETGYSPEEVLGKNPRLLKSGQTSPAVYQSLWETITSGREWSGEFLNKMKNGDLCWESTSISPLCDASGITTHYVAVQENITDRKRQEASLRKTEEQLVQAQKMEAIGRLAGGVAHDFNNLLTAIIGYSDLVLEELKKDDPIHEAATEIKKAGERAASLTRQLLAFSRKQVLQTKVINLNNTVDEIGKMIARLIGEDIELRTMLDRDLWSIRADPGQMEQVILNLVVNSRDAMPGGGKLTIETRNVEIGDVPIAGRCEVSPGSYIVLSVSDTGVGMDAQTQSRIFEPFFTTKDAGKGTGLGLSTVYGIVTQSAGYLCVESEPGRGTTFRIYFPKTDEENVIRLASSPTVHESTESGTVLVVEDEEMVRKLARQTLRLHGYEVLEAANAGEALLICEQVNTPIDLMLTDLIMPRMRGHELAARLRPLRPEMKILFMTGYQDTVDLQDELSKAGTSCLAKPFTPAVLLQSVRQALSPTRV